MKKMNLTVRLQSILLAIIGICLIFEWGLTFIGEHIGHRRFLHGSHIEISSTLVLTLIGIVLIYLAPYLYRKRQIAYITSLLLIIVALIAMVLQHYKHILLIILLCFFIVWIFFSRNYYKIKSDLVSLMFGIRIALSVGLMGYIYGCVGFYILGPVGFHQHLSIYDASTLSFQVLFTLQDVLAPTQQAELFVNSLNIVGGLIFLLTITSLFKPVRFALYINNNDRIRARDILVNSSTSSDDYFKLWPNDKHYYFSKSRNSFLAYKMRGHTAIILSDPSGEQSEFQQMFHSFYDYASSNGWLIAIINATDSYEAIYKDKKLNKLFIGNEAIITIADFIADTSHSKHFRYVANKARREGLTSEYWETPTNEQINSLQPISAAWLTQGGRKEYTFFMGYFNSSYLKASNIMVLKQNEVVIAYINIIPSFLKNIASLDHLRSIPGAPSISMHFLLANLIQILSSQGKTALNIGLAPLSGIEHQDNNVVVGQLLKIIKKLGSRFYSFKGVEQFKNKSGPVWHARYVYYTGGITSLSTIIRDVGEISRPFSERVIRYKIISIGTIILISFVIIQFL